MMTEDSHIAIRIGEEKPITSPGLQLTINIKVGNDCFPALTDKLKAHGLDTKEDIAIAIVKTFTTLEGATQVKKFIEESTLIPKDLKDFIGKIQQNGNKLLIPISLSSLGMVP
jgi:hypothetical protein